MRVLRIFHSGVVDAWRQRERELRGLGVEVELLTARRWNEGGTDVALVARAGEPVTGVRTWGRHPALFVYDPRPLWSALGGGWDVIDVHEEPFSLATAEILVLRMLRRQSAPYTLYSAQNLDKRYPVPFRWLERWALRHAAGISVCNAEADRIVHRKGLPGVASVIPLGIDLSRFRPGPARIACPDRIIVGYVGRLARHKGVDLLLRAVGGDERLHAVVAGDGPQAADLHAEADRLGLTSRVHFLGPLPEVDLPGFYAGLDVLAVPSRTTPGWMEQFGRVAVEAMACGVPVVASNSGSLAEVVGEAGTLVPEEDAPALRDALLRYGTDHDLAVKARGAGVARATECSWQRVAQQYVDMYHRATHTPLCRSDRPLEAIVVAYGAPELLRAALVPMGHLPVTVVDNSSSAEIRDLCAQSGVRYVDAGYNGGFAAGVNLGLQRLGDPDSDVLLVNPDAEIGEESVESLHRALRADARLASVGPLQSGPDGLPARVQWPFPTPARVWLEAIGLGRLRSHGQFAIGSVLMLRAEALRQVGPFDTRFFLYAEETDWAYRASRLGWRHTVVPDATARHLGAGTSTDPDRREIHFHGSQERFLRKHWGAPGWQVARAGQLVGSGLRSIVLSDERATAARRRFDLYRRGPVRVEDERYPRALRARRLQQGVMGR